jgi:saccharopine dehydrogenase (NAD+, L-lysine-forming)
MGTAKVTGKGVLPPEACVKPMDLLQLAHITLKTSDKKGLPIVIEHIDSQGKSKTIDLFR